MSDSTNAIEVEGIGKRYQLGELRGGYKMLTEVVGERFRSIGKPRSSREEFWALRDISFEVKEGETFGIIGHNGAGKSTLLKILAQVTPPTIGTARMRGRAGALLEVGTGFHPELTGRENVFLNGAILGMRKREIEARFDEIVEFADVAQFIDTPVKRYSSGMQLRLAFSVAAHLEPEILIIDEVLSVGDLAFQRKCLGRMEEAAGAGRTVLFVSHNLSAIRSLCDRAVLLSKGEIVGRGTPGEVIDEYVHRAGEATAIDLVDRTDRTGSGQLRFTGVRFESAGAVVDSPVSGEDVEIVLSYEAPGGELLRHVQFTISITNHLDEVIMLLSSDLTGALFERVPPTGEVRCRIPRFPLPTGQYMVTLWSSIGGQPLDWVQRALEMTVAQGDFYGTGRELPESHRSVLVDQRWTVSAPKPAAGLDRPKIPSA